MDDEITVVGTPVEESLPAVSARQGKEIESLDDDASLDTAIKKSELKNRQQTTSLRGVYGWGALTLVLAQLVVANVAFFFYAWYGHEWKVPDGVMQAWLAATVVQVIGIALVVTNGLFPRAKSDTSSNSN